MRRGASPGRLAALGLIASTVVAALVLHRSDARAARRRGLRDIVRAGRTGAGGGLRLGAAGRAPSARAIGPINGLLAQAGSLGSLAGPPLLALWVEGAGWASAPLLLIAIAAVGAACALAVGRR